MPSLVPDWINKFGAPDPLVRKYFTKKRLPYTEETMLDILETSQEKTKIYFAVIALRELGGAKVLEPLKKASLMPNMDIQGTSVLTIAKIAEGKENLFLSQLLLEKAFRSKWYSMLAVLYKEDAAHSALPAVLAYSLKNTRGGKDIFHKNPCSALDWVYLARFAKENPESQSIFGRINKNWEHLPPFPKECLRFEFSSIFNVVP